MKTLLAAVILLGAAASARAGTCSQAVLEQHKEYHVKALLKSPWAQQSGITDAAGVESKWKELTADARFCQDRTTIMDEDHFQDVDPASPYISAGERIAIKKKRALAAFGGALGQ